MDVILHFDLGYMDLFGLCTSLDYLNQLIKEICNCNDLTIMPPNIFYYIH
jgi:hypothetical protein